MTTIQTTFNQNKHDRVVAAGAEAGSLVRKLKTTSKMTRTMSKQTTPTMKMLMTTRTKKMIVPFDHGGRRQTTGTMSRPGNRQCRRLLKRTFEVPARVAAVRRVAVQAEAAVLHAAAAVPQAAAIHAAAVKMAASALRAVAVVDDRATATARANS
jgi:hypothetical protein